MKMVFCILKSLIIAFLISYLFILGLVLMGKIEADIRHIAVMCILGIVINSVTFFNAKDSK